VAQLEICVRVPAAGPGGDDDVAAEFAEQLGACRVLLALADGDVRRMGMPGHDASSPRGPSLAPPEYPFTLGRSRGLARPARQRSAATDAGSTRTRQGSGGLALPAPNSDKFGTDSVSRTGR